ncbi:Hypothetical predicted protein [Cloeon dipterum]|uniref:Uncharacterized protein n=1 Tax=Cloeon dipterum TaxID=197152 RepID=A0A8S1BYE4_9INSE|nr:Hypothetical predicted protein [Cloeon dipterum]
MQLREKEYANTLHGSSARHAAAVSAPARLSLEIQCLRRGGSRKSSGRSAFAPNLLSTTHTRRLRNRIRVEDRTADQLVSSTYELL